MPNYTVRAGDNYFTIARDVLGNEGLYEALRRMNSFAQLSPGVSIRLPFSPPAPPPPPPPSGGLTAPPPGYVLPSPLRPPTTPRPPQPRSDFPLPPGANSAGAIAGAAAGRQREDEFFGVTGPPPLQTLPPGGRTLGAAAGGAAGVQREDEFFGITGERTLGAVGAGVSAGVQRGTRRAGVPTGGLFGLYAGFADYGPRPFTDAGTRPTSNVSQQDFFAGAAEQTPGSRQALGLEAGINRQKPQGTYQLRRLPDGTVTAVRTGDEGTLFNTQVRNPRRLTPFENNKPFPGSYGVQGAYLIHDPQNSSGMNRMIGGGEGYPDLAVPVGPRAIRPALPTQQVAVSPQGPGGPPAPQQGTRSYFQPLRSSFPGGGGFGFPFFPQGGGRQFFGRGQGGPGLAPQRPILSSLRPGITSLISWRGV